MVEVICDTSFLIHLATKRIKNISSLETEIGSLQFVIPDVVVNELQNLLTNEKKKHDILATIDYSHKLKKISIIKPGRWVRTQDSLKAKLTLGRSVI